MTGNIGADNSMENTVNINEMGTTGLIDFVINARSIRGDYQRLQKAVAVIRWRYGKQAVIPFCKAIWASMDTNRWARRRMARQLGSFGYEVA
jgi:hypothetical protein